MQDLPLCSSPEIFATTNKNGPTFSVQDLQIEQFSQSSKLQKLHFLSELNM